MWVCNYPEQNGQTQYTYTPSSVPGGLAVSIREFLMARILATAAIASRLLSSRFRFATFRRLAVRCRFARRFSSWWEAMFPAAGGQVPVRALCLEQLEPADKMGAAVWSVP